MPVKGQAAATLASMGIIAPADGAAKPTYEEADFPEEVRVKRLHGITLKLASAWRNACGGRDEFDAIGAGGAHRGAWPSRLAWACGHHREVVGGLFVLVGLLTRLAGFSLACTMLAAMWLTQIGPAMQAGRTVLGFIPDHPPFATDAAGNPMFAMLLWQLSLLCVGLSLTFSGPGLLSFDRALFPGGRASDRKTTRTDPDQPPVRPLRWRMSGPQQPPQPHDSPVNPTPAMLHCRRWRLAYLESLEEKERKSGPPKPSSGSFLRDYLA
jgi:uncharacterized membrane protein YphA (DoxX/SURF4 family)